MRLTPEKGTIIVLHKGLALVFLTNIGLFYKIFKKYKHPSLFLTQHQ